MKKTVITFVLFLATLTLGAQIKAFPDAVGFGRYATGGRGGEIIKVTNLNNDGEGSFRKAMETSGPRIVVFEVGGVIELDYEDQIVLVRDNVTILGETAPADSGGIIIQGSFRVSADNVIISNVSFALGDGNLSSGSSARDGLEITNAKDVFIDNCSIMWSIDENLALSGSENVTVQDCLVYEALYESIHYQSAHSMGSFINKSKNITFYRNVYISNRDRNTRTARSTFEIINCLYYNFRGQNTFSSGQQWSAIGNRWIKGPQELYNQFLFPYKVDSGWDDNPTAYIEDNTTEGFSPRLIDDRWTALFVDKANAFSSNTIIPIPSTELEAELQKTVGAIFPKRNAGDTRVLNDLKNRTGRIIDSQKDVGNYLVLDEGTRWADADNDGVNDAWAEDNIPSGKIGADIAPSGYAYVEEWANDITGSVVVPDPEPTVVHVENVTVTVNKSSGSVGEHLQASVTVSPNNADDKTGVWHSSDNTLATVSQSGDITLKEAGAVSVSFIANDGNKSDSKDVTITDAVDPEPDPTTHVSSGYLRPKNMVLKENEKGTYTIVTLPSASDDKTGTPYSSDNLIATVVQRSLNRLEVTAKKAGEVSIGYIYNDGNIDIKRTLKVEPSVVVPPSGEQFPPGTYTGTLILNGVERQIEIIIK